MQWFTEGDKNTKFFHSIVNRRRKRLNISKMQRDDGSWAEGNEAVAEEAILFYRE